MYTKTHAELCMGRFAGACTLKPLLDFPWRAELCMGRFAGACTHKRMHNWRVRINMHRQTGLTVCSPVHVGSPVYVGRFAGVCGRYVVGSPVYVKLPTCTVKKERCGHSGLRPGRAGPGRFACFPRPGRAGPTCHVGPRAGPGRGHLVMKRNGFW